jgi:predicted enzyme related to lactoylglutathione lyase
MPQVNTYSHGVPSWVDLGTTDLAGASAFYGELLGWECQDLGEQAGRYTMCSRGGKLVAALSPAQNPGPPYWTTYVNVDDVDEISDRVSKAGGQVIVPPMDVMSAGRMAIYADTTGAVIAAWQPGDHKGAELVNEAGCLTWNELHTKDLEKAKAFYGEVFGWTWGGAPEYAEGQVEGRVVCGATSHQPGTPSEVPDHWLVYFGTDDVDADTEKAKGLGATLFAGPMDIPGTGRFSVLADPQGATFALFRPESQG